MDRRLVIMGTVAALALAAVAALGSGAGGATLTRVTLSAPSFTGIGQTMHNDGNATIPDACAAQVPLEEGNENYGDRNNSAGSFLAPVVLPHGAVVESLTLFANDFDGDIDVHAYLIRKLIADGTTPKGTGYRTMASASSSGAVNDTIRAFTDDSVGGLRVDTSRYVYYLELVVCGNTVEPFAVQVAYSA